MSTYLDIKGLNQNDDISNIIDVNNEVGCDIRYKNQDKVIESDIDIVDKNIDDYIKKYLDNIR